MIELYDRTGHYDLKAIPPDAQPIIFQLPEAFRYGSTKGAARVRGILILTYYPGFGSPSDPENKAFGLDCVGICNGRVLLHVEYDSNLQNTSSPNTGDFVARAQMHWKRTPPYPPNVDVRDIPPPAGFDGGFERRFSNTKNSEIVLFRKDPNGSHYDLTATCNVNPQRETCILHFSLICDPKISVTVNGLDGSYLDRSADIVTHVRKFISAMIRHPTCNG